MTGPRRIQLKRTKGWRMPENTVKVDRTTKWGNPFKVGLAGVPDTHTAVAKFRDHVCRTPGYQAAADNQLRGKNLACWCPFDQPCHADILLELANEGDD